MTIRELVYQLIFPDFCLNCHRLGPSLCQNCYHQLKFYFDQHQIQTIKSNFKEIYFDELQIMANFSGGLAKLIKALKYQHGKNLAPFMAKMLYRHLNIRKVDLITFVPLHPLKLRTRGYNQGQEIAFTLSKLLQTPHKNLLAKNINNQAQAKIKDQKERLMRIKNVFIIRKKYTGLIKNKTIILLDDVITTGATINEASKILKSSGAKQVIVIILASKMD